MSVYRARDRDRLQLFSKNKRDLYATPSAGSEMVTLRSTSPNESDEARKKEIEASNEMESFSPVPVPQTVGETYTLSLSESFPFTTVVIEC